MLGPLNLLTKYLPNCINKCVNDFLVLRNDIRKEENKTVTWNSKKDFSNWKEKKLGLGKVFQSTGKAWTLSRVNPEMPKDMQGKMGQSSGFKPRDLRQDQSFNQDSSHRQDPGPAGKVQRTKARLGANDQVWHKIWGAK